MPALILYNGPIYTLNPDQPQVQAVAIRDGRVVAVGNEGKVRAAVSGPAEGINLRGRAVIPALTDAHVHLVWHALGRRSLRLDDIESFDVILTQIAEHAAKLPEGAWLQGGGWDHSRWGGRWPTAAELDAIVGNRPVLLSRKDGHTAWASSRALAIAGIDDTTPDPAGGSIRREKGKAIGILHEHAIDLVRRHIPEATEEERLDAIRDAFIEAHSYGMVGMHVPTGMRPGDGALSLTAVQKLRERGQLLQRCLMYIGIDGLDAALAMGVRSGLGDRWIRIGGLKLFADGPPGPETAEMLSHYEGRRHLGMPVTDVEEMNDMIERSIAGGLSVMVHAIGDAANRKVLNAIEAALGRLPDGTTAAPIPNRIEHCQILHPSDIPRFGQLGIVASMQPIHCTQDHEVATLLWGDRCVGAYAFRSLLQQGAVLAFGSDAPVESLNPWLSIHAAVTRQRTNGAPAGGWYPEQRLSVAEAIHGFTAGAAHAAGATHEQGRIAPGYLADLAVLSADPFKLDPSLLHTVGAEMTLLEGRVVWERTIS
ncbi:MAG TPA: amidohydrolase [Roseiflexaceae bacterium]|nr:amidohydrolase [Roseiflexaceae bacterium]